MFRQKTLDFLAENRRQNSHQWFHDHKSEYRAYVLEPLKALVEYLAPQALAIDDQVVSLPVWTRPSAAFGGIRAIPAINRCTGRICGSSSGVSACMSRAGQGCILS